MFGAATRNGACSLHSPMKVRTRAGANAVSARAPGRERAQPDLAPLPEPRRTWSAELGMRIGRHFLVTLVATSGFIALFFIGYFQVLRHPAYPLTVMPL